MSRRAKLTATVAAAAAAATLNPVPASSKKKLSAVTAAAVAAADAADKKRTAASNPVSTAVASSSKKPGPTTASDRVLAIVAAKKRAVDAADAAAAAPDDPAAAAAAVAATAAVAAARSIAVAALVAASDKKYAAADAADKKQPAAAAAAAVTDKKGATVVIPEEVRDRVREALYTYINRNTIWFNDQRDELKILPGLTDAQRTCCYYHSMRLDEGDKVHWVCPRKDKASALCGRCDRIANNETCCEDRMSDTESPEKSISAEVLEQVKRKDRFVGQSDRTHEIWCTREDEDSCQEEGEERAIDNDSEILFADTDDDAAGPASDKRKHNADIWAIRHPEPSLVTNHSDLVVRWIEEGLAVYRARGLDCVWWGVCLKPYSDVCNICPRCAIPDYYYLRNHPNRFFKVAKPAAAAAAAAPMVVEEQKFNANDLEIANDTFKDLLFTGSRLDVHESEHLLSQMTATGTCLLLINDAKRKRNDDEGFYSCAANTTAALLGDVLADGVRAQGKPGGVLKLLEKLHAVKDCLRELKDKEADESLPANKRRRVTYLRKQRIARLARAKNKATLEACVSMVECATADPYEDTMVDSSSSSSSSLASGAAEDDSDADSDE
jgi:hypothetical protein